MKSEITKLRKKIYKNLKNKAMSFESTNHELENYLNDQIKLSKRKFSITKMDELHNKVLDSDIIYLGDFHTFDQNIRNVLRIVKIIVAENSNCILGLEMVAHEHQLYIDAYLERHLTDLEFLESINYHSSWRFPWTHYKLIFELAKKHNLKVVGLNIQGSLQERDIFAADLLEQTHLESPESKLLVLYGELHITRDKIPLLMKKKYPNVTHTIIHQNLDEVYWKLIKDNIELGIVAFSEEEYCIISAPPWIKYESMIYWYENLMDDPDFDIHDYIIENGTKIFIGDTRDNFLNICSELILHLKLDISDSELEDFNLYDHTNLEFIEEKLEQSLKPTILSFYKYLISTNKSFRFPNNNTFYCSSYSMNRISYLAGIHLCHYYLDKNQINTGEILSSRSLTNKFILFSTEAMYAYFFSKIINPHRKCDMYMDLQEKLNGCPTKKMAIDLLDSDNISEILKGTKTSIIYEAALYTGHIMGEYLYLKINSMDNNIQLQDFFLKTRVSHESFTQIKDHLLDGKKYQKDNKRYF